MGWIHRKLEKIKLHSYLMLYLNDNKAVKHDTLHRVSTVFVSRMVLPYFNDTTQATKQNTLDRISDFLSQE